MHDWNREHLAVAELLSRANHMPCTYCGIPMDPSDSLTSPTKDHIWPKRYRSISEGRNGTVWCCHQCNTQKGDMLPSEWLSHMSAANPTDGG